MFEIYKIDNGLDKCNFLVYVNGTTFRGWQCNASHPAAPPNDAKIESFIYYFFADLQVDNCAPFFLFFFKGNLL